MMDTNYTYTTIAAGTGDEAGIAAANRMRLMGYSIRETAGAGAVVKIEHGTANSSPVMAGVTLTASSSKEAWFGPQGLPCPNGVWIERVSGTTEVNLITTVA